MRKIYIVLAVLAAVAIAVTGCKAWRTITTTSTYTTANDSTKSSITIQSKTVEEYQGRKKN